MLAPPKSPASAPISHLDVGEVVLRSASPRRSLEPSSIQRFFHRRASIGPAFIALVSFRTEVPVGALHDDLDMLATIDDVEIRGSRDRAPYATRGTVLRRQLFEFSSAGRRLFGVPARSVRQRKAYAQNKLVEPVRRTGCCSTGLRHPTIPQLSVSPLWTRCCSANHWGLRTCRRNHPTPRPQRSWQTMRSG